MKNLSLLALIIGASLSAPVFACDNSSNDRHHGSFPSLSSEQHHRVQALMHSHSQEVEAIEDEFLEKLSTKDKADLEARLDETHEKLDAAIRTVLTPEQLKAKADAEAKREARRKEMAEFREWKKAQAEKN